MSADLIAEARGLCKAETSAELDILRLVEVAKALCDALEASQRRERAAVADIRRICDKCYMGRRQWLSDGTIDALCRTCLENNHCNWKWRGSQEAGEGQDD